MTRQTTDALPAPSIRPGRLRRAAALRGLVRESHVRPEQLIQPLFFTDDPDAVGPVPALPGVRRHGLDEAERVADVVRHAGVTSVLLFGVPARKDREGSAASADDGVVAAAARRIRAHWPQAVLIADVCLCQYTRDGGCTVGAGREGYDHAGTLERYADAAVAYARAGVDLVAPSGMIDGSVAALRAALDARGHTATGILSYAVKFASAMYGPFREAACSAPRGPDRRAHQLDPANRREALREALRDVAEGADALMVKPALAYGDIIRDLREHTDVPLAAYQVSGEYAMLAAAAANGWLDRRAVGLEWLASLRRAGADMIITYMATDAAGWLRAEEVR